MLENRLIRHVLAGVTLVLVGAAIAAGAAVLSARDAQQAREQYLREQLAARHLPRFSLEEQSALVALERHLQHPTWQELSVAERIDRIAAIALHLSVVSATSPTPTAAPFLGNTTALAFTHTGSSGFVLQRQGNCSLSLLNANYSFGSTTAAALSVTAATSTSTHYEQTLHAAAGLKSTADSVTPCVDPTSGFAAQRTVYLGKTTSGALIVAGVGYVPVNASGNSVFYGTVDPSGTIAATFHVDTSAPGVYLLATGDLNGDGLPDLVGVDQLNAQIVVWLTHADGTLSAPVTYPVAGQASGAVVADVNGDGKADVVVTSSIANAVSVLTGKGDGTLYAAQSFTVATPPQGAGFPPQAVIAADLRHVGYPDLVLSDGWVYRNNGSGSFTQVTTQAFAPVTATSSYGLGLVAADFNKDGKLDVAVDDGPTIHLYYGNGDDTFTAGPAYASISNVGYLQAADLDADGNVDLWSGLSAAGVFGGDQYGPSEAIALFGNGDGSFQGAPSLPFVFTGTNVADLNGDKLPDAVGVNADLSLTSYLGDGKGGFAAHSTLVTSPVTVGGTQYTLQGIDSFAIGDLSGDGIPDLAYIGSTLNGIPNGSGGTGIFIALGDGHGGFGAPGFYALPAFITAGLPSSPQGSYPIYPTVTHLLLSDVNGDGKPDLIYNYMYSYESSAGINSTNAGTAVQLSNGNGTFQAPQLIPFYSGPNLLYAQSNGISSGIPYVSEVATIADVNNDGKPDLVFTTQSPYSATLAEYPTAIQVALGHGDGTFQASATVTGPTNFKSLGTGVVVADMNGDGKPDLVAIGADSNGNSQLAVMLGHGDGTFAAPTLQTYSAQYLLGAGLAVADFNGDGKPDVFLSNPESVLGSGIVLGNGDGTLQYTGDQYGTYVSQNVALSLSGIAGSLDLNGDGRPDVLVGNAELLGLAGTTSGGGGGGGSSNPDFALSTSPASGTVSAGSAATTTLSVTPSGGFASAVAFSCTGLPGNASCAFAPTTVTPNGAVATSTLTITTTARSASAAAPPGGFFGPTGTLLAIGLLPAWVGGARRMRRRPWLAVSGALACALVVASCGGGGGGGSGGSGAGGGTTGTPAGTYTVTVSAVSGSTTHTTTYVLTVT